MFGLFVQVTITSVLFIIISMIIPGFKVDGLGCSFKAAINFSITMMILSCLYIYGILPHAIIPFLTGMVLGKAKMIVLVCSLIFNFLASALGIALCHRNVDGFIIESNSAFYISTIIYAISSTIINLVLHGMLK